MTQPELQFDRQSQEARILEHLKSGKPITPLDALRLYGCFRLGGRIFNLKHGIYDGTEYPIETEMIKVGRSRFAQYRMEARA